MGDPHRAAEHDVAALRDTPPKIDVFAMWCRELDVEAAGVQEGRPSIGDIARVVRAGKLVVDRVFEQRIKTASVDGAFHSDRVRLLLESRCRRFKPALGRNRVVIGEEKYVSPRLLHPSVPSSRRPDSTCCAHDDTRVVELRNRLQPRAVVGDHDLILALGCLGQQCIQAAREESGPVPRGYDD
jgi:hypothetical protein